MNKDNKPLMFIASVNNVANPTNQDIFDSRNKEDNKTFKSMNPLEERKLNNIIKMHEKGRPVLCDIYMENEVITATPFKKENEFLKVYITEEEIRDIPLKKISKLVIVTF